MRRKKTSTTTEPRTGTIATSDIQKTTIKVSAILVAVLLVANCIFFALGKISATLFWVIIAAGFGISYMIRKQNK